MVGSAGLAGSVEMAVPYYRRVMDDIRARIARGEWPPGERLPTTEELVEYYQHAFKLDSLSRQPVRRAVEALIESRELRGQQGKGVYVSDD